MHSILLNRLLRQYGLSFNSHQVSDHGKIQRNTNNFYIFKMLQFLTRGCGGFKFYFEKRKIKIVVYSLFMCYGVYSGE